MSAWMIALSQNLTQAAGFTAYVLVTLSVAVGLALSTKLQTRRWPRLLNYELHTFVTSLSLVFIGIHVLTILVSQVGHFGWIAVALPFLTHLASVWMAFGVVAFYLVVAIAISSWLRARLGYRWWRRLHTLTLVVYGCVTAHGLGTGQETRTWWALSCYLVSLALIGTLFCIHVAVTLPSTWRLPKKVLASLTGTRRASDPALPARETVSTTHTWRSEP